MGLYDAAKDAAKVLQEAGKINEYQKILDLIDDSMVQREKVLELSEENKNLKEKIRVKDEYFFQTNCYYHIGTKGGPFCSCCLDKNHILMRLIISPGSDYAMCPECKNLVNYTGRDNDVCWSGSSEPCI